MGEPTNQLFAALQHREAVDQGVEAPQQKERRKKKLEQEQKEKAKTERRKTLWRRLGFKLRVFNMFANKISSDDPAKERLIKLKRKLGKFLEL